MLSNRPASQRLLIEAMVAAFEFISEDMGKDFLIIGGAALVQYGSPHNTKDIDIAITPQSLNTFSEKARNDSRFSMDPDGNWAYTCQGAGVEDLQVEIEFLTIGEEFVPKLRGMTKFNPIWVASLPDIAVMKAYTFQDRTERRDYVDLLYALGKMKRMGQTLAQYRIKESEIATIMSVVGGDEEGEIHLLEVMG